MRLVVRLAASLLVLPALALLARGETPDPRGDVSKLSPTL